MCVQKENKAHTFRHVSLVGNQEVDPSIGDMFLFVSRHCCESQFFVVGLRVVSGDVCWGGGGGAGSVCVWRGGVEGSGPVSYPNCDRLSHAAQANS